MRYSIPAPIAHETLDGEVVILDQESGTYFSLTGAGADIWAQIVAGADDEQIVGFCETSFDGAVADEITALLARLVADKIVVAHEGAGSEGTTRGGAERAPWVSPKLDRFTDLQSLLLLDPIHDVDESGWPRTP